MDHNDKGTAHTGRPYGRALSLGLLATVLASGPSAGRAAPAMATASAVQRAAISGMPLNFELNVGQAGNEVQFLAHGPAYAIALTAQDAVLTLGQGLSKAAQAPEVIRLHVRGARDDIQPVAEQQLPGHVNYYIGNDPSRWITDVATYGRVRYSGVYPGVDLVYYGTQGQLEYDFAVAPGASAKPIGLAFEGAEHLSVDAKGNLTIEAQGHQVNFERPAAYQLVAGQRTPVPTSYRVNGNTIGFRVGKYDHSRALIIDPVLSYFSYVGGSGYDIIGADTPTGGPAGGDGSQAAAVDSAGDLYVTGWTGSTNFPTQAAYETAPAKICCGTLYSAFVTKFARDAKTLIFSTYLGGTVGSDYGYAIALDASGNAFVVGTTESNDFPVTKGAFQTVCSPQVSTSGVGMPNCNGNPSAFISKFSPSGALLDSTFLGGSSTQSVAYAVTVDSGGVPYVAGYTYPGYNAPAGFVNGNVILGFPTTAGAALAVPPFETSGGNSSENQLALYPFAYDAFISVFDPTLSTLMYSSLLGDSQISSSLLGFQAGGNTYGTAVTVDMTGNFYVAGWTSDPLLQVTVGALQTTVASCGVLYPSPDPVLAGQCGFVAKLSPVGGAHPPTQIYGTYLGHMPACCRVDEVVGIAADAAGDAYVAGYTNSAGFPTTAGAYQAGCEIGGAAACGNAEFIAKLNPTGTKLLAATLFGNATPGSTDDIYEVGPIVLDAVGNVYISGLAGSGLVQVNPLGTNNGGATSPFVAELDPSLSTLQFSTLIGTGGPSQLGVNGLALDSAGNIYLAGSVNSPPSSAATSGAFQSTYGGGNSDGFVAMIAMIPTYANGQLTVPSLVIGNATFSSVVVTIDKVISGTAGNTRPAGPDSYNPVTGQLTIPFGAVGANTYENVVVTVGKLVSIGAVAGADTFNGTYLTIPAIEVGGTLYKDVVVKPSQILSVAGGMPVAIQDQYNAATRQLLISAVTYAGHVYTNVTIMVGEIVSINGGPA